MGEVWAATRTGVEGFEKVVALKILLNAREGSNSMVMFFDEARAAAALQHAAIVPTLDLGQDKDVFYIAMEMVRGPSLTALLQRLAAKRAPMRPALVAYIGERIASALDYAHSRAAINGQRLKLIHRDISPHNILVDATGSVRLMDFGVARTAVQDHRSKVGTVRGKPSYMSPEQVRSEDLDARSDVFSLGTVMYESASLRRLFGRGNPIKSMDAVVQHTPTPLPKLREGFPDPLWQIIKKALAKEREDRFADAGELRGALSDVLRDLVGASTVNRDMGRMIEDAFEAGSFELDARIKKTKQEITAQEIEPIEPNEPTAKARPSRTPPPRDDAVAFSEALATNIAWPSAQGTDPFAPDAIEALRRHVVFPRPVSVPAGYAGATPVAATPGFGPSSVSMPVVPPRRSRTGMLVAVAVAAFALAGVLIVVVQKRASTPIELDAPSDSSPSTPGARPGSPGAVGAVRAPEPPETAVPVAPTPPPAVETIARPEPARRPARVVPKPAPPKPAPAVRTPATREEVAALIREVKKIDPAMGSSLLTTLAEAGRDPVKLAQLKLQAQSALRKSEP